MRPPHCRLWQVRAFAEQTGQMALLARVVTALHKGAGVEVDQTAIDQAMALLEPFHDAEADAARATFAAVEKEVS